MRFQKMGLQLEFVFISLVFLINNSVGVSFGGALAGPEEDKCRNRPHEFSVDGSNYFFSDNYPETRGKNVSWLEARNICRKYCMDSISIDSQKEFDMVKKVIEDFLVGYLWTSGRHCESPDCDGQSQWYWTQNGKYLSSPLSKPAGWTLNPWSQTGFKNQPQPDNAEYEINGKSESCLAVLHNVYDDGIKFHDVACYHKKVFICEDSEELLKLVNII